MKALVLEDISKLKIKDISIPQVNADQVLLKVSACSLCRTDAKMYQQGQRDLVLPRVLGHEICGQIDGDKFVVWPGNSCKKCEMCQTGQENLCDEMQVLGFHCDGGLAEYVCVSKEHLFPVPDNLPENIACMAELMACGINALEMADVSEGQSILIYGGGAAGLLMALVALSRGAKPFILELNSDKLKKNEVFRRETGIEDASKFNNMQYDVTINAASSIETLTDGILKIKKGGSFCIYSGITGDNNISSKLLNEIHYRQLKLIGAYGCKSNQMKEALDILDRYQKQVGLLIEDKINLEQVPEALERILSGQVFKYIVEFNK